MPILWCGFILIGCAGHSLQPTQATDAHYALVWSDEFDDSLDTANWNFELGFVRNEEDQYYQYQNVHCEDGFLVIEARRESVENHRFNQSGSSWIESRPKADYTSASINTRNKHAWKFGRFEIKAKIDTSNGLWPAFWTLGAEGEWPASGEIDIMEYYRGGFMANAAWASKERWQPDWNSKRKELKSFPGDNWANEFHVWRMDWTESYIRIFVDDILLNRISLRSTVNKRSAIRNPFHHPHYILLNMAVGGSNGGDPAQTEFPARYLVDYVRIYQEVN